MNACSTNPGNHNDDGLELLSSTCKETAQKADRCEWFFGKNVYDLVTTDEWRSHSHSNDHK
jgi:hypothetical protein